MIWSFQAVNLNLSSQPNGFTTLSHFLLVNAIFVPGFWSELAKSKCFSHGASINILNIYRSLYTLEIVGHHIDSKSKPWVQMCLWLNSCYFDFFFMFTMTLHFVQICSHSILEKRKMSVEGSPWYKYKTNS